MGIPQALVAAGFVRLPSSDRRTWKGYPTWARNGVRIALSNDVLGVSRGEVWNYHGTGRELTLQALLVDPDDRHAGRATSTLNVVLDAADEDEITLYLEPVPLDKHGLSSEQLRRWYARFGFVALDAESRIMWRPAVRQNAVMAAG